MKKVQPMDVKANGHYSPGVIAAGLSRDAVVSVHVYISDIADWDIVNEAYAEFFGGHKPAQVIVPAGKLHHGALVEIEAIAECRGLRVD